jgi:acyl carrier protein
MPPIDGVAVGAMVLVDATFMTQRYEDFQSIMRPKVQGTINLDRLFSGREDSGIANSDQAPLDWFIGFSSLVGVTGNPGQSAYGAGNCFLKALVRDRHDRGLAGSSIDIGRMVGVGYIERALAPEVQERLKLRSSTMSMSETDLHQLFAEAVIAGRPGSGRDPELIAGVSVLRGAQVEKAFWAKNARLGMMIKNDISAAGAGAGAGNSKGGIPVRKLLEAAKTVQDAHDIIVGALRTRLQAAKFLPDADTLHDTKPLVDLGVDSLIAVDMRSWFQKELAVDVPVMKILGGASMVDLVATIIEKLPQDILGSLDGAPGVSTEALENNSAPANNFGAVSSKPELELKGSQAEHSHGDSNGSVNPSVLVVAA